MDYGSSLILKFQLLDMQFAHAYIDIFCALCRGTGFRLSTFLGCAHY